MVVKRGPCLPTLKRSIQAFKNKRVRKLPTSLTWSTRPMTGCGARPTFFVGPLEPLLATVKWWKSAWFGCVTLHESFSKTSFRAPWTWRVGSTVVDRGNAGWTASKSGHPCPCQNCSQGPPAEKNGRGSLLKRPSCSSDHLIGQGTELEWTDLSSTVSRQSWNYVFQVVTEFCLPVYYSHFSPTPPCPASGKKKSKCVLTAVAVVWKI